MKKKKGKGKIPKIVLDKYSLNSIWWVVKKTHLDFQEVVQVLGVLNNRRKWKENEIPYRKFSIRKASGGKREIFDPYPLLKKVQQRINKFVLSALPRNFKAFGFSGSPSGQGSVVGALTPHLNSKSILTLDIKDAFPNTTRNKVSRVLDTAPFIQIPGFKGGGIADIGIAKIICDIAIYKGIDALPQGAPTSPRIFDLVFWRIDNKLARLAKNIGGAYTRYADNIFFSMLVEEFPEKVQRAIVRIIKNKGYDSHKIKVRSSNEAIRALGLNITNGKLFNMRSFKRNMRLTLYILKKRKNRGRKRLQTRRILEGQISWAIKETLPCKLSRELGINKPESKGKQLKLSV